MKIELVTNIVFYAIFVSHSYSKPGFQTKFKIMKIIGDQSKFALEYEIVDKRNLLGYSRIWFGGQYIGSKKELIYFKSYLFDNLQKIGRIGKLDNNPDSAKDIEMYDILEKRLNDLEDEYIYKHLVSFGTLSDDYIIFSYLDTNDSLCLTWKLDTNHYFNDVDYNDKEVKFF